MLKIKSLLMVLILLAGTTQLINAQSTFPANDVANPKDGCYAFINATIIKDAQSNLQNGTLLIRQGKIEAVGNNITIPKDAVIIDCKGKYIYPAFIDIYSDYGISAAAVSQTAGGAGGFFRTQQLNSNTKGAYGWNQAIKAETEAYKIFTADDAKAKALRDIGFGSVLTHQKDGIARGSGAFVTLANQADNFVLIKDKASAHYSFNKGTSAQSYPGSMMGMIALLRQSYLDAQWYKSTPTTEGVNLSLKSWNDNQALPQIFEANDKWNDLRADKIGDKFGVQYIIKAGGNEYQRIKEMDETKAS